MRNAKKLVIPLVIIFVALAFPLVSAIGEHFDEAVIDNDIDVRISSLSEFLERGSFAIATQDVTGKYVSSFKQGDDINFHVDVTSYNIQCGGTFIVVEIYNPPNNNFLISKSKFIGDKCCSGGNNYIIADIPYKLSSSANLGTWNAAGYMWCTDTNLPDIDGNGITGDGERISNSYQTSFGVFASGQPCEEVGFVGDKTCRSNCVGGDDDEDVCQLYYYNDDNGKCQSEYRRVEDCTSSQYCNAGKCLTGNGNGNGGCIEKEGIFYSNGQAISGSLMRKISGAVEDIDPKYIDSKLPGFSAKYRTNKETACCADLDYVYSDSKHFEYSQNWLQQLIHWGLGTLILDYDVYKCVEEGTGGLCIDFFHKLIKPITKSDNCQSNTLLGIFGGVAIVILLTRLL